MPAFGVSGSAWRRIPHSGLLDFGCGEGLFSSCFPTMAAIPPDQLELTLVDPVAAYCRLAAATLRPFALELPEVLHEPPPHPGARLDLVFAKIDMRVTHRHFTVAAGGERCVDCGRADQGM
jgi:hypothetical protein